MELLIKTMKEDLERYKEDMMFIECCYKDFDIKKIDDPVERKMYTAAKSKVLMIEKYLMIIKNQE